MPALRKFSDEIRDRFGRIDVLVNNAAVADPFIPAEEQTAQTWGRTLDIDLLGTFLCARAACGQPGGPPSVVVNVGSINSHLPFAPRHAHGASKHGVDILAKCWAVELGPEHVRTVTIAPGYTCTAGVAALLDRGLVDEDVLRRRIPLGRLAEPAEIAAATRYFASPGASYVSGATIYVDGGWTAFGATGNAYETAS